MLAACYLPRQWPAKYFRLCRALRPCSGWVRVVYLRLATNKLFVCLVSFIQDSSLYAEDCIRYSFINYLLCPVFCAWAILDCYVRFAFASLTTALIKCFVLSSPALRRRIRTSHRLTELEKALVRLVSVG